LGGVVHCLLDEFREEEKARRKIPRKIPHKVEFLKVNQTTLRFYFLISSLSFGVFLKIQFMSNLSDGQSNIYLVSDFNVYGLKYSF
jgi:hypothetical protein